MILGGQMNEKAKRFLINFIHALSANIVRLGISIVMTLLLPKLLGVEEYSYWQLYLFYVTYTAYSSLGWCEGTYLKYGGKEYKSLERGLMASQFWFLAGFQLCFCIGGGMLARAFVADGMKATILSLAMISSMFDILRYLLQTVLQATGRIKQYAGVVTAERVLFFVMAIAALVFGYRDFYVLIGVEIAARIISMLYAIVLCKDVVFAKFPSAKRVLSEAGELIRIGYKLLIALLASQLIIGVIRFCVEQKWGTIVFGKVSLTLSLSNMVITCIGAVSVVLFPTIKKMSKERLTDLYTALRFVFTVPVLAVLIFYVPIKMILTAWLPQYADSLKYLSILFPMCVYETRSVALTDTYLKAFRKEKYILLTGLVSVGLSCVLAGVTVYGMESLNGAIISIVLLMMFKNIFAEKLLLRFIPVRVWKDNIAEALLTAVFIVTNWYMGNVPSMVLYIAAYALYVFWKRGAIRTELGRLKEIVGKNRGEK